MYRKYITIGMNNSFEKQIVYKNSVADVLATEFFYSIGRSNPIESTTGRMRRNNMKSSLRGLIEINGVCYE